MPNWCNNSITITGPKDKITALYEQACDDANDETGLLDAMHPMPKELHDTTSPSDGDNWYDWRVSNWGTKWEVSSEGLELSEDGTELTGWFDSAWAPPIGACAYYGQRNEDVSITLDYHEPGMCFVGRYTIENGVDDDDYVEYNEATADTVRDLIGEDYDDNWGISEMMAEWEEENEDA